MHGLRYSFSLLLCGSPSWSARLPCMSYTLWMCWSWGSPLFAYTYITRQAHTRPSPLIAVEDRSIVYHLIYIYRADSLQGDIAWKAPILNNRSAPEGDRITSLKRPYPLEGSQSRFRVCSLYGKMKQIDPFSSEDPACRLYLETLGRIEYLKA